LLEVEPPVSTVNETIKNPINRVEMKTADAFLIGASSLLQYQEKEKAL
jgi:uncharacterized membrane protein